MLVLTTQEAGQAGDKLSHLQKVGVLKDGTGRGHAGLEFRQGLGVFKIGWGQQAQ